MERGLKLAAALIATAVVLPPTANARVVGIKVTQAQVDQRLLLNPLNPTRTTRTPLAGDLLLSRHNLIWLGNRFGYEPQPWPIGTALMACSITTYPRANCGATYTLVGAGKVFARGPLNLVTRVTQRLRIVRGTRRYLGARGWITVQRQTPTVRVLRFTVIT